MTKNFAYNAKAPNAAGARGRNFARNQLNEAATRRGTVIQAARSIKTASAEG